MVENYFYFQSVGFMKIILFTILYFSFPVKNRLLSISDSYSNKITRSLEESIENQGSFFENLNDKYFIGKWKSRETLAPLNFTLYEGYIRIKMTKGKDYISYRISVKMFEGDFFDKNIKLISQKKSDSLIINHFKSDLIFNVNEAYFYSSIFEKNCNFTVNFSTDADFQLLLGNFDSFECNISFEFNTHLKTEKESELEQEQIRFFSYSLVIIASLQVLNSIFIMQEINSDVNYSKRFSIVSFSINALWNCLMCYISFLAIVSKANYYIMGIASMIYFVNLSFDCRILVQILKINFLREVGDELMVRRAIFKHLIFFYIVIYLVIYFAYYIIFSKFILILFFSFSWIPQIVKHYIFRGPSINFYSALIMSTNKLFIPMYFQYYSENILHFKIDRIFSISFLIIILIQLFLMYIQNHSGPRSIVPSILRKTYDYFRTYNDLKNLFQSEFDNQTCSICLDALHDFNEIKTEEHLSNYGKILRKFKMFYVKYFCFLNHKTKPFMLTPCHHVFHSECLRAWYEKKAECPLCKLMLPDIE